MWLVRRRSGLGKILVFWIIAGHLLKIYSTNFLPLILSVYPICIPLSPVARARTVTFIRTLMTESGDRQAVKTNFKRAKVLIIEDNDDHWFLINRAMQQCLPEVTAIRAATLAETQPLLTNWLTNEWEMPKLILLDLYVPQREDAWQFLQQIRSMSPPCNQVPVVLLSHSNAPTDINEAYQRGVSSYLVKPIEFLAWLDYFQQLRTYWWETVTLPPMQLSF